MSRKPSEKEMPDQELLTLEEIAQRLKFSVSGAYKLVQSGEITGHRVGRSLRFIWSEVLEDIKKRKVHGA